jgi:hypothetical protein
MRRSLLILFLLLTACGSLQSATPTPTRVPFTNMKIDPSSTEVRIVSVDEGRVVVRAPAGSTCRLVLRLPSGEFADVGEPTIRADKVGLAIWPWKPDPTTRKGMAEAGVICDPGGIDLIQFPIY